MTNQTADPIAPYLAAILIHRAEERAEEMSLPARDFYAIFSDWYQLEVRREQIEEALQILVRCRIATVSQDPLAGPFIAIPKNGFSNFLDRADNDVKTYDEIVRSSEDEHEGLNRAESRSYRALEDLNRWPALQNFRRFRGPWISAVLERLRSEAPLEALSSGLPFNSAAWDGVKSGMSLEKLSEIGERLAQLASTIEQSELDKRQRSNALAHVAAIKELLEAPDPPWRVIVELLNSPILMAFLNVTAILSLIFG